MPPWQGPIALPIGESASMSRYLLVVENPRNWDLKLPGVDIVAAREYLTNQEYAGLRRAKIFNLCRTYGYQTLGYYVSLLAAARGHRPLPSVTTIQDLRSTPLLRVVSEDLQDEVQRVLAPLKADEFQLSIYFGRNMAQRYDRLCQALFTHFPAPFLRAEFSRAGRWRLDTLRPIAAAEIPEAHRDFVSERARRYFARPSIGRKEKYRYDLAILVNPEEVDAPSDEVAIRRFAKAAERFSMRPTVLGRDEIARLAEYDALFIRETTAVNHHTYRFARQAEAEGLVVIDDPTSIVRCTNKVYLAELFERYGIPCPRTVVAHRDNAHRIGDELGFPCVLKRPDSAFSRGVVKAADAAELAAHLAVFFEESELVVAQEYTPSSFDWRIGVLGGRALYACKYYMARGHWQILKAHGEKLRRYGKVETLPIEEAPARAVKIAEGAARPIGDGLYGVDVKEVNGRFLVMEVNDNPSIEGGCEDSVLKDELYDAVMRTFRERLDRRGTRENGK
jgi:glutathione synthase/RimK-type ligase-like ATP-grasp enzyme